MQHVIACEILPFALLHCTEWHWGSPMDPHLTTGEASTMMDVHDEVYLECLMQAVYYSTLLLGDAPTLSSPHDWPCVIVSTSTEE